MYDHILTEFPRLPGEASDSPRIQRAIDATENGILCIPKGDYEITETLHILNHCSLDMHPAARLIAKAPMDFVLIYDGNANYTELTLFNPDGSVYDNLGIFIRGGDIEGNGLASCLQIINAHHFTLTNTACHNGRKYGLFVGGEGHLYELIATNVYCKCTMKGLRGNIGIASTVSDCHYTDCIVVDYTIGMSMAGGANRLTRCHIWGGTVAPEELSMREWSEMYARNKTRMYGGVYGSVKLEDLDPHGLPEMLYDSIAFEMKGGSNVLDGCYADTAIIGFRVCGNTNITKCGFFNNPIMGLRESVAIRHEKGRLFVSDSDFRAPVGTERLYEGIGENIDWRSNMLSNFPEDSLDFLKN